MRKDEKYGTIGTTLEKEYVTVAKRKRRSFKKGLFPVIALVILLIFAWQSGYLDGIFDEPTPTPPVTDVEGTMELHVIDIGQGDSLLVKTGEGFILIDTGDKSSANEETLRFYLKQQGVTVLEYVILTHMDADHIGSADMVISEFDVRRVIMPALDESDIPTTAVFEEMIAALEASVDTEVIEAISGTVYELGGMTMKIVAPNDDDYPRNDKNNYSVATRLDFGATSFLLTGDAEELAEEQMLAAYSKEVLDCDFFKAGHHGSRTSSTKEFLAAVTPKIVAISCGRDNKYGHPHAEALERFEAIGATVYRTDLEGTLVFVSDGTTITKK